MSLTDQEQKFVDGRKRLLRLWPAVGSLLLILIALLAGWLYWRNPLLVNPWVVMSRLEEGSISNAMLILMAGILPIMALMSLILVALLVVSLFAAFGNERRHLAIIDRLLREDSKKDD